MSKPAYPEDIDAITPEWLSQALSERFPGVVVAEARIAKRIDGTATKLRYELGFASPQDARGAPASLWVKGAFDPRGASQGEAFANEVNFFRDIAPLLPIEKPDSYYGALDPASNNGVVLLEDLLARGVTFADTTKPLSVDQVAAALSLQAGYHAAFWKSPGLAEFAWLKAGGAIAAANVVDQYFGLWDAAMPLPRFQHVPEPQRDPARMNRALNRLMAQLREEPICLVHGDAHFANLYFLPDGRPGYLDWQHVMRGHWGFDLVNLMITSLTVPDRRAHERALLTHYLSELKARGVEPPSFDGAWRDYRRYAIWSFMWIMCPPDVHPETLITLNTERACCAIADLETLKVLETV